MFGLVVLGTRYSTGLPEQYIGRRYRRSIGGFHTVIGEGRIRWRGSGWRD